MSVPEPRAPTTLTLRPSLRQWWWVFLVCAAGAVTGFVMVRDGETWGWPVLVFFGIGFWVPLLLLWPRAAYLRLTQHGFEYKTLWRRRYHRWADIAAFGVARISGNDMVVWQWAPGVQPPAGTRLSVALTGVEAALGDTYGMKAEQLAALMEEWRARATMHGH